MNPSHHQLIQEVQITLSYHLFVIYAAAIFLFGMVMGCAACLGIVMQKGKPRP